MKNTVKYFLGANSCEGFVSHFKDSYSAEDGYRAYIIKGGPGTGKSSFMKSIAKKAQENGYEVHLCPCSSDPDSLDGVVIPELKVTLLDGTAPHIVEPDFPGACERLIDLGEYWDFNKLLKNRTKIMAASTKNSLLHKRASGYLSASGELLADNLRLEDNCIKKKQLYAFAKNICEKYIKQKGTTGRQTVRFIGAVTPKGEISYSETLTSGIKNAVIIEDRYGAVSGKIVEAVKENAVRAGYDVIVFKNPLLPSFICDHIIIPELSLLVASENQSTKINLDIRRVHSRRFTDVLKLKAVRQRMLLNRRIAKELLDTACETLSLAKASHDELEKYYIKAMDFSAVKKREEKTAEEIFGLPAE